MCLHIRNIYKHTQISISIDKYTHTHVDRYITPATAFKP